jgi:hypothetical protein
MGSVEGSIGSPLGEEGILLAYLGFEACQTQKKGKERVSMNYLAVIHMI